MKTLLLIATIALTGCATPKGTTTAPLVAALQKAKASTDQAIEDNRKVKELARGMGKGVIELDGRLHRSRDLNRLIDNKAVRQFDQIWTVRNEAESWRQVVRENPAIKPPDIYAIHDK